MPSGTGNAHDQGDAWATNPVPSFYDILGVNSRGRAHSSQSASAYLRKNCPSRSGSGGGMSTGARCFNGKCWVQRDMLNVLYVPELKINLF